ncbi:MAG: hypothetical protein CSA38_00590 [Flavobacteriales bacterium]|nr:MAG: hypothetical protein CSA38_00590 [Flavobacteriales bacterium]
MNVAKEPLIEKTTKIKNKSKFELMPHRSFNFFMSTFLCFTKLIKFLLIILFVAIITVVKSQSFMILFFIQVIFLKYFNLFILNSILFSVSSVSKCNFLCKFEELKEERQLKNNL